MSDYATANRVAIDTFLPFYDSIKEKMTFYSSNDKTISVERKTLNFIEAYNGLIFYFSNRIIPSNVKQISLRVATYNRAMAKLRDITINIKDGVDMTPLEIAINEHAKNLLVLNKGDLKFLPPRERIPGPSRDVVVLTDEFYEPKPYDVFSRVSRRVIYATWNDTELAWNYMINNGVSDLQPVLESVKTLPIKKVNPAMMERLQSRTFGTWFGYTLGLKYAKGDGVGRTVHTVYTLNSYVQKSFFVKGVITPIGEKINNLIVAKIQTLLNSRPMSSNPLGHPDKVFYCSHTDCVYNAGFLATVWTHDILTNIVDTKFKIGCPSDHLICRECGQAAHHTETCPAIIASLHPDTRTLLFENSDTKKCPNCREFITKDGGCMHMKCRSCGQDYCWTCLTMFPPTIGYDNHPACSDRDIYGRDLVNGYSSDSDID
jgi:hypothetical protein